MILDIIKNTDAPNQDFAKALKIDENKFIQAIFGDGTNTYTNSHCTNNRFISANMNDSELTAYIDKETGNRHYEIFAPGHNEYPVSIAMSQVRQQFESEHKNEVPIVASVEGDFMVMKTEDIDEAKEAYKALERAANALHYIDEGNGVYSFPKENNPENREYRVPVPFSFEQSTIPVIDSLIGRGFDLKDGGDIAFSYVAFDTKKEANQFSEILKEDIKNNADEPYSFDLQKSKILTLAGKEETRKSAEGSLRDGYFLNPAEKKYILEAASKNENGFEGVAKEIGITTRNILNQMLSLPLNYDLYEKVTQNDKYVVI